MTGKEQEIKALTKLVEMNGYFAEYFKKDLDVMVDNIKKDFPIELGANFNLTREQQEQRAGVKKELLQRNYRLMRYSALCQCRNRQ